MHTFYTINHYKIWFSDNKDIFLDIENQLEFIRIINRNPKLKFRFVYSSTCLNPKAQTDLKSFCERYNVIPVDFDTEIKDMVADDQDKKLYELAQLEIKNTVKKQGGSFAAASDFTRQILPVISKCGIYEDFELDFDYKGVPDYITAESPILIKMTYPSEGIPSLNNDRLAYAVNNNDPSMLSSDAIKTLRCIQRTLITNHANPKQAILQNFHKQIRTDLERECQFSYSLLQGYFKQFPNATVFQLRLFIQNSNFVEIMNLLDNNVYCHYVGASYRNELTELKMKTNFGKLLLKESPEFYNKFNAANSAELAEMVVSRFIRHRLLTRSVVAISGPQTLFSIVSFPEKLTSESLKQGCEKIKLSDISKSFPNCYKVRSAKTLSNPIDNITANPSFQLSWTLEGKKSKNNRIEKMVSAAKLIQSCWKSHNSANKQKPKPADDNDIYLKKGTP